MEHEFLLTDVVPIIRRVVAAGSAPGDSLDDIIAIYADRLLLFTAKRKNKLPDAAFEPEGSESLRRLAAVGPMVELDWDEIGLVECSQRIFYGSRPKGSREQGREIRIYTRGRGTTRVFLPEDDAVLVRQVLPAVLAGRYADDLVLPKYKPGHVLARRKERSPSGQRTRWLLGLLIAFVALGIATTVFRAPGNLSSFLSNVAAVSFLLAGTALLLVLFNVAIAGTRAVNYESNFKKERALEKLRSRRAKGDLSGRKAIRSRLLGWLLKIIGAGIALVGVVASDLVVFAIDDQNTAGRAGTAVQTLFFLVAVIFIYYGYLLCQRPAERALTDDPRPPILFLRPFEIDGRTDLNPQGLLAQTLGLESFGWLKKLGPFGNVHPLRLLRLLFSITADHSEEQMARYFQRYGPFVAIGKPGERFSLGGASRFYVTDAQWQDAVLNLLEHAQFVVLQPSLTPGVRWEIEQTVKTVSPERILLCLTWFAGSQARYDEFRLRFTRYASLRLPRSLGDGNFACFDAQGRSTLLPMRLRTPFMWPLSGCAVSFQETLRPFFARLKGMSMAVPPPPGKVSWFMQGAMACLFWLPTMVAVDSVGSVATAHLVQSYKSFAALRDLVSDPDHHVVESGPGWTWALPSAWHRNPRIEPVPEARSYTLGENVAAMSKVYTIGPLEHFTQEMSSGDLLDSVVAEAKTAGVMGDSVIKRRITLHDHDWEQAEYDGEVSGLDWHYVVRVIVRPKTRVILKGWAAKNQFEQFRLPLMDALDHLNLDD